MSAKPNCHVRPNDAVRSYAESSIKLQADNVDFYYGNHKALSDISLQFRDREITALIGPSGCGKSTFLRSLNRMNDLIDGAKLEGSVRLGNQEIYGSDCDVVSLRRRIGMVFQKPTPFAKSIFENVVYGVRLNGMTRQDDLEEICETSLKRAALWDEVKDRLDDSALALSGGQQQRLCIARALAVQPEVLLMDEPASALDPIATEKLEEGIMELKNNLCIVIVTHNMQQAERISDKTAFFYMGKMLEYGKTEQIFHAPIHEKTAQYVGGRFG